MANEYYTHFMPKADLERLVEFPTLKEFVENFKTYGKKLSVWSSGLKKTYDEFYGDIALMRGWLAESGISSGDHVGIIMSNRYEFLLLFFAATTMGAVAVPISPATPVSAISLLTNKLDVKLAVCDDSVIQLMTAAGIDGINVKGVSDISLRSPAPAAEIARDMTAMIMPAGGVAENAKGVILTHRNIMRGTANSIYGSPDTFNDSYFAVIPFTHIFGILRCALSALYCGCDLFLCEDMRNIFRDIQISKPTLLVIVPAIAAMIHGMIATKGMGSVGGRLKYVVCGGAAISPELVRRYKNIGIDIYPGYGLTESSNLVSGNMYAQQKPTSVGRPYAGQTIKIVDGELWIKGDNITPGYYKDDAANAEKFSEDGFFKTGDLVRLDEDGDIYITGRKKNLIILANGENVSTDELEKRLNALPQVKKSRVYEGKSAIGRAAVCAEIVPDKTKTDGDVAAAVKKAVDKLNSELPDYMHIKKLDILDG